MCLIRCIQPGRRCWIGILNNKDCEFPLKIKNPTLDTPQNWTFSYGTSESRENMENARYFNDMEKELTLNWQHDFRHNVNRRMLNPESRIWYNHWRPKDGIPYWIPDPKINKVFVVVYENGNTQWWAKLMHIMLQPLKLLPRYSKLCMDEYTLYTLRLGDLYHGYSIEFQRPKHFSFH